MNISYEVLFVYYLFVDGVDEVISEKKIYWVKSYVINNVLLMNSI